MSDNDLIRRGDALYAIAGWEIPSTAIAALPAVTVGVPEATVRRAVLDWIRDDTGAAVKMSMTPDRANALTARILAALEPQPAPDAVGVSEAADRIEALVKERDGLLTTWAESRNRHLAAEARAERLEAALREIESISVHSGGEIHGVTALQWKLAVAHAQDVASSALSDVATASAALHRSFPEAGDGRPLPPMGDELMSAGLSAEDARFVAVQLAQNGYTLTKRED